MRRKDREVIDISEIETILIQCKTCHVAMVSDGAPYVVPLSFGYKILDDGVLELYFHSAWEGKKLDILKKYNKVCFEMAHEGEPALSETPCNSGYYFSSVIGYGDTFFIDIVEEKREALSILYMHQFGKEVIFTEKQAENVCVFKISSTDFKGKRKLIPE
jgi:nitroimidazol reductase NimA-like FMN-containing flavoprotein (pyridoxamine 5'-phosphate oxidase superfamily)